MADEDEQELTIPQIHSVNPQLRAMVSQVPERDVTNPSTEWCNILGVKVFERTGWQKSSSDLSLAAWTQEYIPVGQFIQRLVKSRAEYSAFVAAMVHQFTGGKPVPLPTQQEQQAPPPADSPADEATSDEPPEPIEMPSEEEIQAVQSKLNNLNSNITDPKVFAKSFHDMMNVDDDSMREYNLHLNQRFIWIYNGDIVVMRVMYRSKLKSVVCAEDGAEHVINNQLYKNLDVEQLRKSIWDMKPLVPLNMKEEEIVKNIADMARENLEAFGIKKVTGKDGQAQLFAIKGKYNGVFGPLAEYTGE